MIYNRHTLREFLTTAFSLFLCTFIHAQTSDSIIVQKLHEKGISFSHNNSVTLLIDGQEKFDDLFKAIRQAKSSIHLEYFNFRNDSLANSLFRLLEEKAHEGVEVRTLFDAFGNASNNRPLKKRHLDSIRSRGVEIYKFDPIVFPWINHVFSRDHRKIAIIDGQVAYTGGMNVADYYLKGTKQVGSWNDLHCRIEGSEVGTLQHIFLQIWNKVSGQHIDEAGYNHGRSEKPHFEGLKNDTCPSREHKTVGIINREPLISNDIMRYFYVNAIDAANDSLKIINPYFTLNRGIKKALRRAIERGVKVEIMLSTNSDIPLTPDCGFYNAHKLMKKGAKVWMFTRGFHHTKLLTVDGRFCTVGSANLNARSLNFDYENNAVIIDSCTTQELDRLFDSEKKDSYLLTPHTWNKFRTPWQKFRGWLSHLLAPFL